MDNIKEDRKVFFLLTKNYLINVDEIQTLTKTNKITNF